ncbi:PREDICTED: uncharacterized protein LOC106817126 [Priapulus caudatus]|uniref:Uncharacterized protein LOC106817126 n=1 Tax=Priapulus caudatus TaxID=37621 RepID=A0ABM1EYI8_PRICU|nr:PREDICTED: uncharacterized protein LOC106817126 [Priapulus caudatus]
MDRAKLDWCIIMSSSTLLVIATIFTVFCVSFSYPLHAKCSVDWTFGKNCSQVNQALVDQIALWSTDENCRQGGEKCLYLGFSTSETWYAVLDSGTNYCNLHNLITGTGLDTGDASYKEKTSNSVCTQYSSANCEKY